MDTNHTSPSALITGAGRGIGAALAHQLATHGYHVWVGARRLADAERIVRDIAGDGHCATPIPLDLDDPASIDAVVGALGDTPLDLLVNNAARFADWTETASTTDLSTAQQVMDTNLFGTWRTTVALLPALRRASGARIVNVGSGGGSHGDPAFGLSAHPAAVSYAVSKAALHALTAKLAAELAPESITVVAADPGLTATAPGMDAMGARPVEDGARSILTAALAHDTGTLTRDGKVLAW